MREKSPGNHGYVIHVNVTEYCVSFILGGTNLIVSTNWKIKSEVASIFTSLEDKRPQSAEGADTNKVLKLIGTNVFGSITIKSY